MIPKRKIAAVGVLAVVALTAIASGEYLATITGTRGGRACPNIFASVSFSNYDGFTMVTHPTSASTELVLYPNSVGSLTVEYSSPSNNLSSSVFSNTFSDRVSVFVANVQKGTLTQSSDLEVSTQSIQSSTIHEVDVTYKISSNMSNGTFVLGLPSTCLTTIVEVGSQPYTGGLTWLNGTHS